MGHVEENWWNLDNARGEGLRIHQNKDLSQNTLLKAFPQSLCKN